VSTPTDERVFVDETPTVELDLVAIRRELDAHPTWTGEL
jgi:hypothetical protein